MRSAVFGRYWSTAGGAEKYGGVIAEHLAGRGPVDLLGFEPVDLGWLAERLQLDLTGVTMRLLDDVPGAVSAASADYDVFVNVSFMSRDRAAHLHSLYVVHFPTPVDSHLAPWKRALLARSGRLRPPVDISLEWGSGFWHRDRGLRGVTWTSDRSSLYFTTRPGAPVPVELVFGHQRPAALGVCTVEVEVPGDGLHVVEVHPPRGRFDARRGTSLRFSACSPSPGVPVEVVIRAQQTFVPAELDGGDDKRELGVPLAAIRVGRGARSRLAGAFPALLTGRPSLDWIDTYGVLASNSEFTRGWVQAYWGTDSEVLYPPVTLQAGGTKEPIILHVGRFFDAEQGHSKKQLELVHAFRALHDSGRRDWTLHLVGGCAPDGEGYLAAVRNAAAGYPVVLHVNAAGEELRDLYARASIYWHASGLGEDAVRNPDRLEHFGIATVEAMSAGAVPVVVGLAGQLETVRHAVDGFHFATLDELVERTQLLIDDPVQRGEMARSAAQRAADFSHQAFTRRLDDILDRLTSRPLP